METITINIALLAADMTAAANDGADSWGNTLLDLLEAKYSLETELNKHIKPEAFEHPEPEDD